MIAHRSHLLTWTFDEKPASVRYYPNAVETG
jgi:hypothetical protein